MERYSLIEKQPPKKRALKNLGFKQKTTYVFYRQVFWIKNSLLAIQ